MPREALNANASKPGVIVVPSSTLSALARAITSCGSEMSAGVILFITSAAVYPSMRSAPTLKICDRGAELDAERFGARDHFLRIGNVGRRDLVHHLGGRVSQHALGADVEDL